MPRTFKFSFPLPGRKPSDDKVGSPASLPTPNDSHDTSPFTDPGSKAERVLGTLDPAPSTTKASRKALRKKPSFMSVTISEAESDSAPRDGFPFPGMSESRDSSRRPTYNLRNQSSSPLLGERFTKPSPGSDSLSDISSPRPHFYGSSSTLRSYYDPARSPLSISQQTSASSARDMALRKGQPTISSPLSHDASRDISPAAIEDHQRPATNPAPAQNLVPLDLADLFPQPHIPAGPILSVDEVSKSPTQLSYPSSPQSGSTGRPNWWKRRKDKESRSRGAKPPLDDPSLDKLDGGVDSLKINIKKPKAGTQHWFDGVNGDPGPGTGVGPDEARRPFWNRRLNNLQREPNDHFESHLDNETKEEPITGEKSGPSEPAGPPMQQQMHNSQSSPSKPMNSATEPQRPRSRSATSAKADLCNQSFLELSSSSEDESEQIPKAEVHNYRGHRIRDSIDHNATAETVVLPSAEKTRAHKPKPIVSTSPRRSKRGSEIIPPVPKIPERPQLQQRMSSMRWRESTSVKSPPASAKSVEDSSMSSPFSYSKTASTGSQDQRFGHGSKMMTVTAEEGELLEAMRKTRASIRQGVARNFSDSQRPKTAGTDGRASYFGSDRSGSPVPAFHSHMYRSSNGSERSFAFPQVPTSSDSSALTRKTLRQAPPTVFPPPKCSPSASSFNTNDMMPSTPRSNRLSPITPISSAPEDDFGGSGSMYGNSLLGMNNGRSRHERKRTMSSGVVMLDAVGERDRGWELEDEAWGGGREERW
ncbi:MAG: hypothetical protein Q9168_003758 [Polycauliona sp. 1 TL-2023]